MQSGCKTADSLSERFRRVFSTMTMNDKKHSSGFCSRRNGDYCSKKSEDAILQCRLASTLIWQILRQSHLSIWTSPSGLRSPRMQETLSALLSSSFWRETLESDLQLKMQTGPPPPLMADIICEQPLKGFKGSFSSNFILSVSQTFLFCVNVLKESPSLELVPLKKSGLREWILAGEVEIFQQYIWTI